MEEEAQPQLEGQPRLGLPRSFSTLRPNMTASKQLKLLPDLMPSPKYLL